MLSDYLRRWQLISDGAEIVTPTSRLLPVRAAGVPAMLKIVTLEEEKRGGLLMDWWGGEGAARVLARSNHAVLMERAEGGRSLVQLVRSGKDDEASRILCAVVAKLHTTRAHPPPDLTPLAEWFRPLEAMAQVRGGVLTVAAETAARLLEAPEDSVTLHGDIHHANILDFGHRGWLAIDPKGLVGERHFDHANLFCNPDFETAMTPGRFWRQIEVVAAAAHLQRSRLLAWVLAWAGLSAAFQWEDGLPTDKALAFLEMIVGESRAVNERETIRSSRDDSPVQVRILLPTDADAYRRVRLCALAEYPPAFGSLPEDEPDLPQTAARLAASDDRCFFGAFQGEQLIGIVRLSRYEAPNEKHRAYLGGLFVLPSFRRVGCGRALVRAALHRAANLPGLRRVNLSVVAQQEGAIRLYRSLGFRLYGTEQEAFSRAGQFYDEHLMTLSLLFDEHHVT